MSKIEDQNKIKICRECHIPIPYSKKFCSNGCERKPPHLIEGKPNTSIEPREILLTPNEEKRIRWICISCHEEYSNEEINGVAFKCKKCNTLNDIYPFTFKNCGNCKDPNDHLRKLPLEAKACDLCGKSNFIINNNIDILRFKKKQIEKVETALNKEEIIPWEPTKIKVQGLGEGEKEKKNLISLSFHILNNNFEEIVYGDKPSTIFTMEYIIRNAKGFVPDSIYMEYLNKFSRNTELFSILFDSEKQQFSMKSSLDFKVSELDIKYTPKGPIAQWIPGTFYPIPENKLLELKSDFLRIQLWVN